jgi:hypothetical protein
MKTLTRRLDRLEGVAASVAQGPTQAKLIRERRRRRLEASGQPFRASPPVDYTGCRTIADRIVRARHACLKHQLAKEPKQ